MRKILIERPVGLEDVCTRHRYTTMHYIEFLEYNYAAHTVKFLVWCELCFNELEENAPSFHVIIACDAWVKMINQERGDDS